MQMFIARLVVAGIFFMPENFLQAWQQQHPFLRFPRTQVSTSLKSSNQFTLEYSTNFQRHVVRNQQGNVVRSYQWLEDALEENPEIELLPVECPDFTQNSNKDDISLQIVAGGGLNESNAYTFAPPQLVDNETLIRELIQDRLKLLPSQVDSLFETLPELKQWTVPLLDERLQFMLSPFPPPGILHQANLTGVDWPLLFSNGWGAGMDTAQISHALAICPHVLLRRDVVMENLSMQSVLPFLYLNTPAIVVELTQKQMDVVGSTNLDCIAFSFFHWKGWEFTTLRIMVQAFPSFISMGNEPSWETMDTANQRVRRKLVLSSLRYLRLRLQLRPSDVVAMIKTHPQLSYYTVKLLKRSLDALQVNLDVKTPQVRKLVLRLPSLLGMSVESLTARIQFWTEQVGLSVEEMKLAAIKQPAILQYSIENNLEPKLSFFLEDLQLTKKQLSIVTQKNTPLWGRSLENHLKPLAMSMVAYFDSSSFQLNDLGALWTQAPELARYKWEGNQETKLLFLEERLQLNRTMILSMVQRVPRILAQGMESSLEAKIHILEAASPSETGLAFYKYPSLLLLSKSVLRNRVKRALTLSPTTSIVEGLNLSKRRRRTKMIKMLDPDGATVEMFEGLRAAASYSGISVSQMHRVLKTGKSVEGFRFVHAESDKYETTDSQAPGSLRGEQNATRQSQVAEQEEPTKSYHELTIIISGKAYPPEKGIRGRRRSGGLALQIPQFSTSQWRYICQSLWKGHRLQLLPERSTVLLGYSFSRPSGPRCSLYSALQALRVILVWWERTSSSHLSEDSGPISGRVRVITDSPSVVELCRKWNPGKSFTKVPSVDIVKQLAVAQEVLPGNALAISWERSWNATRGVSEGALLAAKRMHEN